MVKVDFLAQSLIPTIVGGFVRTRRALLFVLGSDKLLKCLHHLLKGRLLFITLVDPSLPLASFGLARNSFCGPLLLGLLLRLEVFDILLILRLSYCSRFDLLLASPGGTHAFGCRPLNLCFSSLRPPLFYSLLFGGCSPRLLFPVLFMCVGELGILHVAGCLHELHSEHKFVL